MHYAVLRLCDTRLVVALVERWQLGSRHGSVLVEQLERQFDLPVLLVAADDSDWRNAKAYAEFESERHLYALIALEHVEWNELPANQEVEAA